MVWIEAVQDSHRLDVALLSSRQSQITWTRLSTTRVARSFAAMLMAMIISIISESTSGTGAVRRVLSGATLESAERALGVSSASSKGGGKGGGKIPGRSSAGGGGGSGICPKWLNGDCPKKGKGCKLSHPPHAKGKLPFNSDGDDDADGVKKNKKQKKT